MGTRVRRVTDAPKERAVHTPVHTSAVAKDFHGVLSRLAGGVIEWRRVAFLHSSRCSVGLPMQSRSGGIVPGTSPLGPQPHVQVPVTRLRLDVKTANVPERIGFLTVTVPDWI